MKSNKFRSILFAVIATIFLVGSWSGVVFADSLNTASLNVAYSQQYAKKISTSCYGNFALAIKNDQTVVGWGGYDFAGSTLPPANLNNVIQVSAGGLHSLALKSDGTLAYWGYGGITPPDGLNNVIAVSSGYWFSIALKSDGTVVGWGYNPPDGSSIQPPDGLSGVVAIATGYTHALALKSDGTVVCWGTGNSGQTSPPAGLNNVVAIAAGSTHSLALKSDGTVVAWGAQGSANYGQATVPTDLSNVVAIAGGYSHSLALKSDGTVVGWGGGNNRNYGQVTPPQGLKDVIAISSANFYSLALKSDGKVVSWGWFLPLPGDQSVVPSDLNIAVSAPITEVSVLMEGASGYKGKTITVPIKFENLTNVNNCDFSVAYNIDKLEAVSVSAGTLVTEPNSDFKYNINPTTGIISFVYNDETQESRPINQSGVFANIAFKLKDTSESGVTSISFDAQKTFGERSSNRIEPIANIQYIDGLVTVIPLAVNSLALDSDSYALKRDETHQTTVTATYNSGDTANVTANAQYVLNNTNVVTVGANGVVTALMPGVANITVSFEGIQKVVEVRVLNYSADLAGINIGGVPLDTFDSNTTQYTYKVPFGQSVPTITQICNNGAHCNIVNETVFGLLQRTNINVTSEDGTSTKTYIVDFKLDILIGDANGDGNVDSIDYARVLQHLLRQDELTGKALVCADVDGDGKVDSIDYAYIRQFILKKITKFPLQ